MFEDKKSKWRNQTWRDRLEDACRNIYWEHWVIVAIVAFSYAVAVDALLSMVR